MNNSCCFYNERACLCYYINIRYYKVISKRWKSAHKISMRYMAFDLRRRVAISNIHFENNDFFLIKIIMIKAFIFTLNQKHF